MTTNYVMKEDVYSRWDASLPKFRVSGVHRTIASESVSYTTTTMAYVSVEADDVRAPSFLCQYTLMSRVDVASRGRAGKARVQMCVDGLNSTDNI